MIACVSAMAISPKRTSTISPGRALRVRVIMTVLTAKAAASKKDYAKAVKLANKAKAEGEMGYAQSMAEKNAGPWVF